ncbi:MAG TPA: hypothetical protein VGT24_10015 [Candidatus Acidoferrales bacterium]|nr:hypothetical protein [Candidatus Acidoferrales bacterium]
MRFYIGKKVGPVWIGASESFHPSRIFLTNGSRGGYAARGWFVLFGLAALAGFLWLCYWVQH